MPDLITMTRIMRACIGCIKPEELWIYRELHYAERASELQQADGLQNPLLQ